MRFALLRIAFSYSTISLASDHRPGKHRLPRLRQDAQDGQPSRHDVLQTQMGGETHVPPPTRFRHLYRLSHRPLAG